MKNLQYYIYKISLPDGRYYIGKRNLPKGVEDGMLDNYWGSGPKWVNIYKAHKTEAKKEVLFYCFTKQQRDLAENILIGDLHLTDPLCCNCKKGGEGGWDHVDWKGKPKSEEAKQKMRDAWIERRKQPVSTEARAKMSIAQTGRKHAPRSDEWKEKQSIAQSYKKGPRGPNKNPSPPHSEETKQKMSAARKAYWAKKKEF
jgi:hypothetical protein